MRIGKNSARPVSVPGRAAILLSIEPSEAGLSRRPKVSALVHHALFSVGLLHGRLDDLGAGILYLPGVSTLVTQIHNLLS